MHHFCRHLVHHWYMCDIYCCCFRYIFISLYPSENAAKILILILIGSGFTLTSSKGPCGIVSGSLTCGTSTAATTFLVSTPSRHKCSTLTSSKGNQRIASYQRERWFLCLQCPEWKHAGNCVHIKLERPLNRSDYLMAVCLGGIG